MKYLSRKIIREETIKVNPELVIHDICLSKNPFHIYETKTYVIKIKLGNYIFPLVINQEVIKISTIKSFRKLINSALKGTNNMLKKAMK